MEIQQSVAKNIREIRESRKLTLDGAAKLTGVSRSMLVQMEKGEVNPTISVLWKIANGYKVPFTALLDPCQKTHRLYRREEQSPLAEDEGRYINRPAIPFQEDAKLESCVIEIREGGFLQAQPHMSGVVELLTVFSGETEVTAGEEVFRLREGDSLRFDADTPHSYRCVGTETVRMNMILYYR